MEWNFFQAFHRLIREQITPKGDGNVNIYYFNKYFFKIREQITPKGDGNFYK